MILLMLTCTTILNNYKNNCGTVVEIFKLSVVHYEHEFLKIFAHNNSL